MAVDELRYDKMVEEALRGVVHESLTYAAQNGLPGDHHFYVTFRTHFPGLSIPDHLVARHPEEMTIVLQHQFWDLVVEDEFFGVTLSFSGKPERLTIPLAAITGFADPSAKFGLQFQAVSEDEEDMIDEEDETEGFAPMPAPPATKAEDGGDDGKVVTLDRFRKK